MTNAPTITALAGWFGAKRSIASDIMPYLGDHQSYLEPFTGSMAMLFAKKPAKLEIVNDLNREITNVGECLQDPYTRRLLLHRLKNLIPTEALFRKARDQYPACNRESDQRDVDAAVTALTYWWLGMSGLAGTKSKPGYALRYSPNGGNPMVRWASVLRSLSWMADRLRGVVITSRCAGEMLAEYPDAPRHTIYCDPPYIRKTAEYEHDFAGITEQDGNSLFGQDERLTHEGLAKLLNRFEQTRVVVSYYDEPELDWLYPAPRWLKVKLTGKKAMANANGGGEVESPEVLLINDGGRA